MQRFKDFFKTKVFGKISALFSKSANNESTAKHSLEKLGSLLKRKSKSGNGLSANFQWEQIFSNIFAPEYRKRIHQTFIITLIVSATYGLGKTAAVIFSSSDIKIKTPPRHSSRRGSVQTRNNIANDVEQIRNVNLFNARESDKEAAQRLTKKPVKISSTNQCTESRRKSSLPIKLINTIVLQDSVKSIASIQLKSGKELMTVRQGDKIKQYATVGLIDRRRVILQNLSSGACEHIENIDSKRIRPLNVISPRKGKKLISSMKRSGIKNDGNKFTIKKNVRDKILTNISDILTQARAIQIRNPDGTFEYKIEDIVPGSIYTQFNIQNGDIISEVNGKKIKNMTEIMNMFANIKDIDHLEIGTKRDGSEIKMEYNFED